MRAILFTVCDNYSNKDSYPFGTGWGAGPVSPAMVNEWKDWAAKQTYTDGYKEDPRLTGSIWSYKALDPNVAGNVLMDCTMDEGEPEYTVSIVTMNKPAISRKIHQYQFLQ